MRNVALLLGITCAAIPTSLQSQSFPFESFEPRQVALGYSGVAAHGSSFGRVNPAAIFGANRSISAGYRKSQQESTDLTFGITFPLWLGNLEVNARRRDWGEIAADLGITGLTTFEQGLRGAYAFPLFEERVALGFGIETLHAEYIGTTITGYAADAGVLIQLGRNFSVGAAYLHAGPAMKGNSTSAELPTETRVGGRYTVNIKQLDVAIQSDYAASSDASQLLTGLSVQYNSAEWRAAANMGIRHELSGHAILSETEMFAGGSLRFDRFELELAQPVNGPFSGDKLLSLALYF